SWTLPYTSMPRNFPRGQVVVPDVFEGNSHAQNYGARDSLLNYHRLMETQNGGTEQPPAEGQPTQPAEGEPPPVSNPDQP
ncbi:MAG: hypothetical protein ACREIV_05220, partial [Planctomycetaceae bacterium]